jgi:acyl carrier protein
MEKEKLMEDLKKQIVAQFNLKKLKPEDIGNDEPLFVEGLGLDSIDALELIVLLQQEYKVKLANPEDGPNVFRSVNTMADYILQQQAENAHA